MLKKIGVFLCALILIPTITNAKLNEIEKVKEIHTEGYEEFYKDKFSVDYYGDVFTMYSNNLDVLGKYTIPANTRIEYNEDLNLYIEKNNNEIRILDKDFKVKHIIKKTTDEIVNVYLNNIIIENNSNNTQTIYNMEAKKIVTINNTFEILSITNDRIITNETEGGQNLLRTYDLTGKQIYELVVDKENENIVPLGEGYIYIFNDVTLIAKVYDKNLKKIKEYEEEASLLTIENNYFYTVKIDPKNPFNPNNPNITEEFKKNIYKKISIDTKEETIVTFDEVLKLPIRDKNATHITVGDVFFLYNLQPKKTARHGGPNYFVTKYKDELFVLINESYGNAYLYQISTKDKEIKKHKIDAELTQETDAIDIYESSRYITTYEDGLLISIEPDYVYPNENIASYSYNVFMNYKVTSLEYNINTQVKGKGSIVVDKLAKPGNKVQFTVTPDKGYVIDKIYIVDVSGNKKEITNKDFIMPEEDITIEVIFNLKNPETNSFVSYIAILFTISIIMIIYINREKDKTLRYKI